MSDKYGDIARSLGCEVTEEAESLRIALVKESARAAAADAEIERLRAELNTWQTTVVILDESRDKFMTERDEAKVRVAELEEAIYRWSVATASSGTHRSCSCAACVELWRQKVGGGDG